MKTSSGRGDAKGSIPDGEPKGPERTSAPELAMEIDAGIELDETFELAPEGTKDAAPDALNGSADCSSISVKCMD